MDSHPDFDDAAAMAVYADALVERGDPRGELIQLHLAAEESGDPKLKHAIRQCLAKNDRALLGPLRTATSVCDLRWRRGYIVEARLYSRSSENAERARLPSANPPRLPRIVRQLLELSSAQPLHLLELTMPYSSVAREHLLLCVDEVPRARHAALRELRVVMSVFDGQGEEVRPEAEFQALVGCVCVHASAGLGNEVVRRLRR